MNFSKNSCKRVTQQTFIAQSGLPVLKMPDWNSNNYSIIIDEHFAPFLSIGVTQSLV